MGVLILGGICGDVRVYLEALSYIKKDLFEKMSGSVFLFLSLGQRCE